MLLICLYVYLVVTMVQSSRACAHAICATAVGGLVRPSLSSGGTFFSTAFASGIEPMSPLLSARVELLRYNGSSW